MKRASFFFQEFRRVDGGADEIGTHAGADGARAERRRAGIAGRHDDIVGVDAEGMRHRLGGRGFMALALRCVALEYLDLAARIQADGRGAVAGLVLHRHHEFGRDTG